MQIGRTQLTPEELQQRTNEGQFIYFAQMSHFLRNCPVQRRHGVSYPATLVSFEDDPMTVFFGHANFHLLLF